MIEFRDVSKHYLTSRGRKVILDGLTLTLPRGAKVGVLGRNGAGKSTLIGMIAGIVRTDRRRDPPRGQHLVAARLRGQLRGRSVGRAEHPLRGADLRHRYRRLVDYVQDFAELGDFIDMPVRSYSSGMKARLAFGLSMGVHFDWYLVDEITAVGDAAFRKKSLSVFKHRLRDAGMLMVSHSTRTILDYCTSGLVLENGRATYFENVRDAIALHDRNMKAPVPA